MVKGWGTDESNVGEEVTSEGKERLMPVGRPGTYPNTYVPQEHERIIQFQREPKYHEYRKRRERKRKDIINRKTLSVTRKRLAVEERKRR